MLKITITKKTNNYWYFFHQEEAFKKEKEFTENLHKNVDSLYHLIQFLNRGAGTNYLDFTGNYKVVIGD